MAKKRQPPTADNYGQPGIGTDSYGGGVVDPTANVIALVQAEAKRLDEMSKLERERVNELFHLRAQHTTEIRHAESARIDAIRAVDVGAVAAAAQVSATQATTLATTVASSAEALRNQVAAAASAQTVALAAALDPIQKDIADLRRAQYEAQGQQRLDPSDVKFGEVLERIGRIENTYTGRREQRSETRAQFSTGQAVIGVVVAVIAAIGLYLGLKTSDGTNITTCKDAAGQTVPCVAAPLP